MPLFNTELKRLGDEIRSGSLRIYAHTAAPSNADYDNGRVTGGGTGYTGGQPISFTAADADGDLTKHATVSFGTATSNVGDVSHVSIIRGSDSAANAVLFRPLPDGAVTINSGDTLTINANSLNVNLTTT